jgi:hypothetical protein
MRVKFKLGVLEDWLKLKSEVDKSEVDIYF